MANKAYELACRTLDVMARTLERRHAGEDGIAEVVSRLNQQDLSPAAAQDLAPARKPACRHLPGALAAANRHYRDLVPLLGEVAASAEWRKGPGSEELPHVPGLMTDYAYMMLIGPSGFIRAADFGLGLFVIGPDQFYPSHWHDAPELYWLLSDNSDWQFGDGDWHRRPAASTLWNEPRKKHATRVNDKAFFSIWCWTRDLAGNYAFTGHDPVQLGPLHRD